MPRLLRSFLVHVAVLGCTAAVLLPLGWMFVTSLKPEGQILTYPPRWVPETVTLENFQRVLSRHPFGRWAWNSVVVAAASTVVVLVLDALAGYALARLHFRGRDLLFTVIVSVLLVPIQVTVVPLFLVFSQVRMLDTYAALILPTTANVTGVFLMRQFFLGIPAEIEEAARIDGCGAVRTWWSVVLPLSRPALAAVAALTFVGSWNNFLWPLIVISSDRSRTLPVGTAQYMGATAGASGSAPSYGPPMASAVMATLPALMVFFALQRYFVRGVTMSGLKG